jgi:hypothetical protein
MFSFKTKELPNMLPTLVIVNPIRFLFNDAAGCHVVQTFNDESLNVELRKVE